MMTDEYWLMMFTNTNSLNDTELNFYLFSVTFYTLGSVLSLLQQEENVLSGCTLNHFIIHSLDDYL